MCRPTGSGSPSRLSAGRPPTPLDGPPRLDDDVDLVAEAAGRRRQPGGRGGGGRHGAGPAVLAAAQLT